jgi:hypothetical protein
MPPATRHLTIIAGESVTLVGTTAPWSLSVAPAAGGAVTVELSNGTTWHPVGDPLTAPELIVFPAPVAAIRVSAAAAAATVEVTS